MAPGTSPLALLSRPAVRRALVLVGSTVALAAVVFAGAALSVPRRSEPPRKVVTSLSPANEGARLVGAAEAALASGETTRAKELLRQALALDPSSEKAQELLDATSETAPSAPDTSGISTTPASPATEGATAPPGEFSADIPVRTLLPTAVAGYSLGTVVGDETDAVVTAEPQVGSPASGKLTRVLLTVRKRKSTSEARSFITLVSERLYTENVSRVSVAGESAYFGTDGRRLATVAFVRGRYVFELLGTADTVPPAETRDLLVTVAEAFPTQP